MNAQQEFDKIQSKYADIINSDNTKYRVDEWLAHYRDNITPPAVIEVNSISRKLMTDNPELTSEYLKGLAEKLFKYLLTLPQKK